MSPRGVAILGATGSIGRSALRVLARHPREFRVAALAALNNVTELREQAERVGAPYVGVVAPAEPIPDGWCSGASVPVDAATRADVDIVLNAVVGAAGLGATLAALGAGKRVALANKESLVVGGELVEAAPFREAERLCRWIPSTRRFCSASGLAPSRRFAD